MKTVLLSTLLLLSHSILADGVNIKLYKSSDHAERYSHLMIYDYPRQRPAPDRRCIMQLKIDDVQMGDIYWISGQFQVTNPLAYQVEITKKLTWETGSGGINGEVISAENGYNLTPEQWHLHMDKNQAVTSFPGGHHGVVNLSGAYVAKEYADLRYICVVAYAGGSSFTEEGDYLPIDQKYGHLNVLRVRGGETVVVPNS